MAGRQSAAVDAALRLVAQGWTQAAAAKEAGVAIRSVARARQRAGLPALPAGRPSQKGGSGCRLSEPGERGG